MHFTQLILLLSLVLDFTIPEGQADGVYQVSLIDGQEAHSPISAIGPTLDPVSAPTPLPPSAKLT